MKHSLLCTAVFAGAFALASAAQADNATVDDALKSRPELSVFYDKLVSTGVINELKEGQHYTVFAPTNEAFAKIPQSQYPCFYSSGCKAQLTDLLRKHIIPGEKHLSRLDPNGGIHSLFSIDNQHLVATEDGKDHLMVEGQNVLNKDQLGGGMLYEVDGVLATEHDLSKFVSPAVVVVQQPPLPPKVETTSTKDATTPIPYK